jgi:hypothetical protein
MVDVFNMSDMEGALHQAQAQAAEQGQAEQAQEREQAQEQALVLTELLYPLDEVEISAMESMLDRSIETKVLYFWLHELHVSGYNLADFMIRVYLMFYNVRNPLLEPYVTKKIAKYEQSGDIRHMASLASNLRASPADARVFVMWQHRNSTPNTIYRARGAAPKCPLSASIHHGDDIATASLITSLVRRRGADHVHRRIVDYYVEKIGCPNREAVDQEWVERRQGHDTLRLMGIVAALDTIGTDLHPSMDNIPKRVSARQPDLEEVIETYKSTAPQRHLYLAHKRRAWTSDTSFPFRLARRTVTDLREECAMRWEYYARTTPSWAPRLAEFNASFDAENNVVFPDDDHLEDFYERYYMDFDEQPTDTQAMSLHPLSPITGEQWLAKYVPLGGHRAPIPDYGLTL